MSYRLQQTILIVSFIGFCWLMMQVVHEAGHIAGALATRGKVQKVVLHPLAFARTDISPNPHPLLVVWAGPIVGTLLPVLV